MLVCPFAQSINLQKQVCWNVKYCHSCNEIHLLHLYRNNKEPVVLFPNIDAKYKARRGEKFMITVMICYIIGQLYFIMEDNMREKIRSKTLQ